MTAMDSVLTKYAEAGLLLPRQQMEKDLGELASLIDQRKRWSPRRLPATLRLGQPLGHPLGHPRSSIVALKPRRMEKRDLVELTGLLKQRQGLRHPSVATRVFAPNCNNRSPLRSSVARLLAK